MKMLMIIIDNRRKEELELVLRRAGVEGYTQIPDVYGFGTTGEKMGSAVAPGSNSILFVLLDEAGLQELMDTIRRYCAECSQHIRMLHWDAVVEM
jgi:uncharacterized protein YaaQ